MPGGGVELGSIQRFTREGAGVNNDSRLEAISKGSGKDGKPDVVFPGSPPARHLHSLAGFTLTLLLSCVSQLFGGSNRIPCRSPECGPGR